MKKRLVTLIPLAVFVVLWETISYVNKDFSIFFSSPSRIATMFFRELFHGDLLTHTFITAYEALTGLVLGLVVGCCIGFSIIYFPKYSKITYPYVVALSSIPTFALAPLMIIWFGTGLIMKIVLSFLATVFTTAFQAYEGAQKVATSDILFFELNHASNKQRFWMLSFPSSLDWVIQSLKLNSGFCVLGAFIGEFIASEAGLGYIILKASGLYDTTYVFVAIICIIFLSYIFGLIALVVNNHKLKIIRFVTRSVFPNNDSIMYSKKSGNQVKNK